MPIEISPMTSHDMPDVLAFWLTIDGIGLNESDTTDCLDSYLWRNAGLSLVAREDGRLIGAILCGHDGRRGYLHHLAVAPSFRRRGLGTSLVEQCLARLAAIGIQKCNIFVYADNDDGSEFWRKIGWHDRTDLKLMQRPLRTPPPQVPSP
jgi:ribosomal protein S18 acetylase RimI-like enzyme